jgi:hypothetical protein
MMSAMSGDAKGGSVRRRRPIERVPVPPGPVADLKKLVYELYLEAGTPSLDELAAWVAEDDELPGAPERDTIHRIIRETGLSRSQADVVAVVTVLARAARWDLADAARRARDLWVAARLDSGVGVPITEVTDPFALEVHRPISLDDADEPPLLPRYVRRAHDEELAAVVARVCAGESAMAVLVGESSAGKTRACWEALEPLRTAGGWRLWHPYDPTRSQAALAALDRVAPRTVVWLNEAQEYLRAEGDGAERVAAKLRHLLTDAARAPVLILGTLWPEHHAALTQHPGSQVRQVLEGTVIAVPDAFTSGDLTALVLAAANDPLLARAVKHADEGQITQYLAGGPELVERFRAAPLGAKAVMWAAMDARRMGHRNALPLSFLEEAAQSYLTDAQWERLDEGWLEQALAYTSQLCKGARGPVTRIRLGRRSRAATTREVEPTYRLADYLDQYGRTRRADQIPPAGFWQAAATYAHPHDLTELGLTAEEHGLYRDAAQLLKKAAAHGDPVGAHALVRLLHAVHPADARPMDWVVGRVSLHNTHAVEGLLRQLHKVGATGQVEVLAERAVAHVSGSFAVASLLQVLREIGATGRFAALVMRAADEVPVDDLRFLDVVLRGLREVGATEQVGVLAERAVAHTPPDNLSAVELLLGMLRRVGATEQVAALVERAADHVPLDDVRFLGVVLRGLREVGATDRIGVLAERAVKHIPLGNQRTVQALLDDLYASGATEQVGALAERAIAHVSMDDPTAVESLLHKLNAVEATDQFTALAAHAAHHVSLDDPFAVEWLLVRLRRAGAVEHATTLARRAVPTTPLDDPLIVSAYLGDLHKLGAAEQVATLVERATPLVAVSDPSAVAILLARLHEVGAAEQAAALAERATPAVSLDDISGVAVLLGDLHKIGATEQVVALAERVVSQVRVRDSCDLALLLGELDRVGATVQALALAERVTSRISLNNGFIVDWLVGRLDKVGATEQAAAVAERAAGEDRRPSSPAALAEGPPASGVDELFTQVPDPRPRSRFGRQPDGTAATRWAWEDLS